VPEHLPADLLFKCGYKERSHICIVEFIRESFPELEDEASLLDNYRKNRHMMLYGIEISSIKEDAEIGLEYAERFIKKIEDVISEIQ